MNVRPCRCTPTAQCRRCRDIEYHARIDPERAMKFALAALQERQADQAERDGGRRRSTQAGQIAAARQPGRTVLDWRGRAHGYRLRIISGPAGAAATLERQHAGKGPWRRMPYPQAVVDKLAELAAGRQWRTMPLEGEPSP